MIEKLANLWNTNKWLFWLLVILAVPAMIFKALGEYNKYKATQGLENTEKTDNKLKADQDALNKEANSHKDAAEKAGDRIENRHDENGLDLDWHKKEDE